MPYSVTLPFDCALAAATAASATAPMAIWCAFIVVVLRRWWWSWTRVPGAGKTIPAGRTSRPEANRISWSEGEEAAGGSVRARRADGCERLGAHVVARAHAGHVDEVGRFA